MKGTKKSNLVAMTDSVNKPPVTAPPQMSQERSAEKPTVTAPPIKR
ncbi:hypothetical protein N0M98_22360 [Paenibacillus doosanensis]|nr:hypothetical protein [Paenibacillus doosanensis]MCS7462872.1 hypothetical protein [Paenibacillus doosanensis]